MAITEGMRIRDNDPRGTKRVLTVVRVDKRYAYASGPNGAKTRILLARIFADAKERRTGFTVMSGQKAREPDLVSLTITTKHPQDYVLLNEADGTRWRGTLDGGWAAEPIAGRASPARPAALHR